MKVRADGKTVEFVDWETTSIEESACERCGRYASEIFLHATGVGLCSECLAREDRTRRRRREEP